MDSAVRIQAGTSGPRGALALAGAWADAVSDDEIDAFVERLYADRSADSGRPVRAAVQPPPRWT